MAQLLKKTLQLLVGTDTLKFSRTKVTERDLIQQESRIGGQLFGQVPENHHRQFFNLDPTTWVWYEEWKEGNVSKNRTTRYEIHENGVLKVQDDAPYYFIEGQELDNLLLAMRMYYERVAREVYHVDLSNGKALAV